MRATQPRSAPFVDGLHALDPRGHTLITAHPRNAHASCRMRHNCVNGALPTLQQSLLRTLRTSPRAGQRRSRRAATRPQDRAATRVLPPQPEHQRKCQSELSCNTC